MKRVFSVDDNLNKQYKIPLVDRPFPSLMCGAPSYHTRTELPQGLKQRNSTACSTKN